jgi:small subunit ribosomal protein S4e
MTRHLKRHAVPKSWPVPRKGTTFVVRPSSNTESGLPVLIILRDLLKLAQNRKEVKKAINSKEVLLNGRPIKEDKNSAVLFDVINVVPSKKNYKIVLKENGKFGVEEISEKDAGKKVSKIVDKKILKGKKIQLNLGDGRNVIYDKDCKVNDSVLMNMENKKVEKILPLKEKSSIIVFAGKHAGKSGEIENLNAERKMASVKGKDGEKINVLIKQLMVVD